MKVAIVGSPKYTDETKLFPVMSAFLDDQTHSNVVILTGSLEGVERSAEKFARRRGLDCVIFRPTRPADNSTEALMKSIYSRNKQIVDNADKILIFWDESSPETRHIIRYAKAREVACMTIIL